VRVKTVASRSLLVAAGTWNFHAAASWTTEKSVTLISVSPYMQQLGTEMQVTAKLPDGTTKNLVWVREYDENQQMAYVFRQPVVLPASSRVQLTGYFDNSGSNRKRSYGDAPAFVPGSADREDVLAAFVEYIDGPPGT
jgi:hypothetical protein